MFRKDRWIDFLDRLIVLKSSILKRIEFILSVVLFLGFGLVLYQIGVPKEPQIKGITNGILRQIPRFAMLLYLAKWVLGVIDRKRFRIFSREFLADLAFFGILFIFDRFKHVNFLLEGEWFLYMLICVFFVVRVMRAGTQLKVTLLNPSILFVVSFLLLIMIGTALLLVPSATNGNLNFVDALFTATSAVCVTGLTTVDTASKFTELGKDILLIMIQIGGLGLMTFTNFFSVLFRGEMSFRNHLILQNIIETDKPNSLFATLIKIVIYTLLVEVLGVFYIYFTINTGQFASASDEWMFAIFHSISAFCNAGFSTLPNGLFNEGLRFNYNFQLAICFLVILGGIGFPVVNDLYTSIKNVLYNIYRTVLLKERYKVQARNVSVNSRIVLTTTFVLLFVGMFLYFATEYNNVLKEHTTLYGKLVQSFFGSVTPRTAGFNTVDMGELMQGTILVYLLFMWIGASPSSTGGGIKTTTFAIAFSNIVSLSKGKSRVDLFKREISSTSIHRAFAVIFLSLLIIGSAVFGISLFDPNHNLTEIAFECFSAYSTVGLSLNITATLSAPSKLILVLTMFIGRVGMFTLLFGIFNKAESRMYQYPKENIIIT
ncbi:MAG: trk system potassium uptake protein TrkH [Spirosomataceae bacterium]|jgi:potassium uptake TrkH family protein